MDIPQPVAGFHGSPATLRGQKRQTCALYAMFGCAYSYIAQFTAVGVMVDGYGPRTDGHGNCAHPTWAEPHRASYRITRLAGGDVQFDVWMDRPDLFGEYMATFVGTNENGRLVWRRVEYLDLGSPRYLRAGLLEPIRFAGVEHDRRHVWWNSRGEIRLTAEVSVSRAGRLTFRDPETGLAQWLHEGHAMLSDPQYPLPPELSLPADASAAAVRCVPLALSRWPRWVAIFASRRGSVS